MNIRSIVASTALLLAGAAFAQPVVNVQDAWARASVPGQKATGAFMTLTASEATRLVGVSTPAAGTSEVHEMRMQGDVMKMRAIDGLDLPAGQPVQLKPGGYHVMMMALKAPLAQGATLPLTLHFRNAQGQESSVALDVPVRALATPAAGRKP